MSLIRAVKLLPAVVALLLMAAVPAGIAPRTTSASFENSHHPHLSRGHHGHLVWNASHPAAMLEEAEGNHNAEQFVRLIAGLLAVPDDAVPSFVPAAPRLAESRARPRRILPAHRSTGPPAV